MRLSEAIERLANATRADGRSSETVLAYRKKLKPLVNFLNDAFIESITADDLRQYIVSLMDRRLSIFTIAGHVRAAKRLFNFLESEGFISESPMRKIHTPRPKASEPKAVEMSDFLALLRATQGNSVIELRDRAIILMLADTGCRVGGLCNLRARDIDFDAGLITLREKGDKTRLVPFSSTTREAIMAWLAVRPATDDDWLFVSLSKKPTWKLSTSGVIQMLKRRARNIGIIGRVNPHAFRHFFAREFLLRGGDLATLSDLLGHSSVEVTKSNYAIFTVKELQEQHQRYSPVARLSKRAGDS